MNYIIYKNENALYYECGYSCDNAIFLKLGRDSFFITDGRYEIDAKENLKNTQVIISKSLVLEVAKILKKYKIKQIIIDPNEWSLFSFNLLKENTPVKFKLTPLFSHKKRLVKSNKELEYLSKAVKLGRKAFKKVSQNIKEGLNEQELNFLAESILRDYGKRELSFEPILAVDENASKPHALPTKKVLKNGATLLFDAGVKYKRYCSDRTRTVAFKDGFRFKYRQKFKSKKIQKAYDTVLKAHDVAIDKARSGMSGAQIDKLARDVIEKANMGKYFVHSTGHGVGLDIHEMPYISTSSDTIIEDNMVFTIEPGIYIEGEFGIRVEDMVVIKNGRAELL